MFALIAQTTEKIINPAVPKFGSGSTTTSLASLIVTVWRTAITVGGLALLVMLILGGLEWVFAGGDKGKIEHARDRITQSIIGLLILLGTVAISILVGTIFGINLLQPNFQNNINSAGGATGTGLGGLGAGQDSTRLPR